MDSVDNDMCSFFSCAVVYLLLLFSKAVAVTFVDGFAKVAFLDFAHLFVHCLLGVHCLFTHCLFVHRSLAHCLFVHRLLLGYWLFLHRSFVRRLLVLSFVNDMFCFACAVFDCLMEVSDSPDMFYFVRCFDGLFDGFHGFIRWFSGLFDGVDVFFMFSFDGSMVCAMALMVCSMVSFDASMVCCSMVSASMSV